MVDRQLHQARDSRADWTSNDPTLNSGEIGYETDDGAYKIADGATAWTSLAYSNAPSVTAMPTSPETDMRVWRSDLDKGFYYDGTRWLSDHIHHVDFAWPVSTGGAMSSDTLIGIAPTPYKTVHDLYIVSVDFFCFKNVVGTWVIQTQYVVAPATLTLISSNSFTHSSGYISINVAVNATIPSTAESLRCYADETAGSATVYPSATINFRLIGT